ncbi:MAG: NUDIX hydrolase [Crocinitomicaceae bacterium]|nr:NUDIX hydrolase [Crocinitomicaceae bacterium]|tara:strand:- start:885 stop:1313 length:429 start_codon:yes stop_codon:yes gene_type:complete
MQMRAGSLVINEKKELLLIYRKGKWDFPKGKVEKNEKKKTGALREASEETGLEIEKLSLQQPLKKTAHLLKQKKIKTKWYLVNYKGSKKKLKPQKEEGIEKCIWVSQESLVFYIPYLRSYAREVLVYYIQYVQNPLGIKFVA